MLKQISLSLLCLQNLGLLLLFSHRTDSPDSRAVLLFTEILKLVISTGLIIWRKEVKGSLGITSLGYSLVPSVLYYVQTFLCYFALFRIQPIYFALIYQAKILTTALFSMMFFSRTIRKPRLLLLVTLFIGVSFIQIEMHRGGDKPRGTFTGVLALAIACTLSGFNAIYSEWLLKGRGGREKGQVSVFVNMFQSSFVGTSMAIMGAFPLLFTEGIFFRGFDLYTFLIILFQSVGGFLVVMAVVFADSVFKTLATCVSISVFGMLTITLSEMSLLFISGSALVLISVAAYSAL